MPPKSVFLKIVDFQVKFLGEIFRTIKNGFTYVHTPIILIMMIFSIIRYKNTYILLKILYQKIKKSAEVIKKNS